MSDKIREKQDVKEMTRNAIKILIACGDDPIDLIKEFQTVYGEEV